MNTRLLAALLVIIGIVVTLLLVPPNRPLAPPPELDVAPAQEDATADIAQAPPRTARSTGAAPAPESEVRAPATQPVADRRDARRIVLRGTVSGTRDVPPDGFEVLVRRGVPARQVHSLPIAGDGPFTADLTEALDEFDPRSASMQDRVSALVVAAGYAPCLAFAQLDDSGDGDVVTLTVELALQPLARIVRGRVVSEFDGRLGPRCGVEFVPAGASRAEPTTVFTNTNATADGSFELQLTDASQGDVIVFAREHGVLHVPLSAEQVGEVDLGVLTLTRGATISGHVPGAVGDDARRAAVIARAALAPAAWNERARGVQASDERVHFEAVEGAVAADGSFELSGLEPGLRYGLTFVPGRVEGRRIEPVVELSAALEVIAPASGVTLEPTSAAVVVTVRDEVGPVDGATVREELAADDPRRAVPEALRKLSALGAARGGEQVVLCDLAGVTMLRVSAPGHADAVVALEPSALPLLEGALRGPFVVQLTRSAAPAALEFRLRPGTPGALDGALLIVSAYGNHGNATNLGPVPIVRDTARFEDVPTGPQFVRLSLFVPQTVRIDALPYELLDSAAESVALRAGETTVVERTLPRGGRIELSLIGRDPTLGPPEFVLVGASGDEGRLPLYVPDPRGHDSTRAIATDGPILLGRALEPGAYTVRQVGGDYARTETPVEVRRGATTRLQFQLERAH